MYYCFVGRASDRPLHRTSCTCRMHTSFDNNGSPYSSQRLGSTIHDVTAGACRNRCLMLDLVWVSSSGRGARYVKFPNAQKSLRGVTSGSHVCEGTHAFASPWLFVHVARWSSRSIDVPLIRPCHQFVDPPPLFVVSNAEPTMPVAMIIGTTRTQSHTMWVSRRRAAPRGAPRLTTVKGRGALSSGEQVPPLLFSPLQEHSGYYSRERRR